MVRTSSMTVANLVADLDKYLHAHTFEDSAINGLQVANTGNITTIATAVSASLEAIEKAIVLGVQALIVHHGIFRKNDSSTIVDTTYRKVALLLKYNIALICYHLPLDAHREIGNNWKAARDLGLHDLRPFLELHRHHIGVIGTLDPLAFNEFQCKVERYYGRAANIVNAKNMIANVAIVSGKADRCIVQAKQAGADCFITGTSDEPVWDYAHEEQISFMSLGHYATETVGPQALAAYIQTTYNLSCQFIKTDNPF
jgi:dinuclear metal center YbgI/SA1388 family protein